MADKGHLRGAKSFFIYRGGGCCLRSAFGAQLMRPGDAIVREPARKRLHGAEVIVQIRDIGSAGGQRDVNDVDPEALLETVYAQTRGGKIKNTAVAHGQRAADPVHFRVGNGADHYLRPDPQGIAHRHRDSLTFHLRTLPALSPRAWSR